MYLSAWISFSCASAFNLSSTLVACRQECTFSSEDFSTEGDLQLDLSLHPRSRSTNLRKNILSTQGHLIRSVKF
ncbi:hypothetical protein BDP27DRAFT_1341545 [Rhodocollybia butyracea]|uniref:Secreted protein n=1 Tax=Rhodocollybia butyracea TaxID=206335 RepID=A0A9P5P8R8_9AGAR|nr:hypothetical protein BDP27DRAFT_1341545 [Rhodocollybia butyracea]